MTVRLGTNIEALKTLRQLDNNANGISRVMERLSSGLRINRASDDAAGLSVSSALNNDARIFAQGMRNVNDGLSLLNIAGGALDALTQIVIRQSELATQAANGIYAATQRSAMNREVQELRNEYNRITNTVSFNGVKLLDGTLNSTQIQAGKSTIGITLGDEIERFVGDGTFQPVTLAASGITSTSIMTGDFDGDGDSDILIGGQGVNIRVKLNDGNGNFTTGVNYTTGNKYSNAPMAVGDVNGDGVLDIVSADGYNSTVSVLIGNGNGTFKSRISFDSITAGDIRLSDLNGDSVVDLIVSDVTIGSTQILLGNGNGSFKAGVSYFGGQGVAAAHDFNGDGFVDIASASGFFSLIIALGNGDGTLKSTTSFSAAAGAGMDVITVGDFNGDGKLDIIGGLEAPASVQLFLGNGDGTFKRAAGFTVPAPDFTYFLDSADINEDGFEDVVISQSNSGSTVTVLLGRSDGTLTAPVSYATGAGPRGVTFADVNGDEVKDLLTANNADSTFGVLIANTRTVTTQRPLDISTRAGALAAISSLRENLTGISNELGNVGVLQTRLSVAHNNLAAAREQYLAASSRITDADIASTTAELVRRTVLQKAGAAVLAQANQIPTIALKLLKG